MAGELAGAIAEAGAGLVAVYALYRVYRRLDGRGGWRVARSRKAGAVQFYGGSVRQRQPPACSARLLGSSSS